MFQDDIIRLDNSDPQVAAQVWNICQRAYANEAEKIDFWDIPNLKETVKEVERSDEIFFGYRINGELAGIISCKLREHGVVDIHRLAADTRHFRQGIGLKLLHFILEEFKGAQKFIVSAAAKNIAAARLYSKAGFFFVSSEEVKEGIVLIRLERLRNG